MRSLFTSLDLCKHAAYLPPPLHVYSDVVVQIVDGRSPLTFRCDDVAAYVNEVDASKKNLLLINKADMLTKNQRALWARYGFLDHIQCEWILIGRRMDGLDSAIWQSTRR